MMENNLIKFNYNSSHNNFPAIESLNPIDIGTERQFRFTAKMLAEMLDVSFDTIKRRVELLESTKDLSHSNLSVIKLPDSNGRLHETTIYDLKVLNKLAMTMIDNPIAVNVREAFNDIIVQVETKGQYNIQIDKHDLLLLNISKAKTDTERAIAISELEQFHEDEKRALKADNENLTQVLTDTSEKLITAIRTKAQIGSKREATAMSTAANLSKKNKKLENDLTIANDNINTLTIANNQLQEQLDDTYSSLYRDKRVAEIIKGKYEFITYKFNTLKQRVNKALKAIALGIGESIKEKPNPMNDTYAPMLYFTKRTVDQLLDNIEKDRNYLKQFSK